VGVKTPVELGGSKKQGKGGNKSQAVVLLLLQRLSRKGYHVFLDNLFVFTRFLELLRDQGYGATGICRTNSGVHQDLITMKKNDSNNIILWGTTTSIPTESEKMV
jgi:hypothetical protein